MRNYATFIDFCCESANVTKRRLIADIPLPDLKRLCDAWRDGRCYVTPCHVGDRVYSIYCGSDGTLDGGIEPHEVDYFYIDANGVGISEGPYDGHLGHFARDGDIDEHGVRRLYFSLKAAEAALAVKCEIPQGDRTPSATGLPAEKEKDGVAGNDEKT